MTWLLRMCVPHLVVMCVYSFWGTKILTAKRLHCFFEGCMCSAIWQSFVWRSDRLDICFTYECNVRNNSCWNIHKHKHTVHFKMFLIWSIHTWIPAWSFIVHQLPGVAPLFGSLHAIKVLTYLSSTTKYFCRFFILWVSTDKICTSFHHIFTQFSPPYALAYLLSNIELSKW